MSLSFGSVYWKVWHALLELSADPDHQVAEMVRRLTEQIKLKVRAGSAIAERPERSEVVRVEL